MRSRLAAATAALVVLAAGCGAEKRDGTRIRDQASGIELVLLPAGEFVMGSPESEAGREEQERAHRVRLTRPFYLGVTEVTQGQWQAITDPTPVTSPRAALTARLSR